MELSHLTMRKYQEIGNIGIKLWSDTPRYLKIQTGKPIAYWQSHVSANKFHLSKKQGCKGYGAASDASTDGLTTTQPTSKLSSWPMLRQTRLWSCSLPTVIPRWPYSRTSVIWLPPLSSHPPLVSFRRSCSDLRNGLRYSVRAHLSADDALLFLFFSPRQLFSVDITTYGWIQLSCCDP